MKIIKLTLIALLTLVFTSTFSQAEEKIKNRKARITKFLVKNLELTEEEQKSFLPIYENFLKDFKTLRQNFKKTDRKGKKLISLSDEEIETILNNSFEFKQKSLDLKKMYHLKYKQVLPIKKIAKLYHLEKRMKSKLKNKREKKRKRRRN